MGKSRKRFIDPKVDKVHKFMIGHRSQHDPFITEEKACQRVLVEIIEPKNKNAAILDEENKYGIYADDDDYNYLKHLRDPQECGQWEDYCILRKDDLNAKGRLVAKQKLLLPSSVFECPIEETYGVLEKTLQTMDTIGPRPDLDPDIVAELEKAEGEEYTNDMPDDFIAMLNSEVPIEMPPAEEQKSCEYSDFEKSLYGYRLPVNDDEKSFDSNFDNEERDELRSLPGGCQTFLSEETKSHFTNYSLTSSVLPRENLLATLDEQFEETFLNYYDDEHMGPLDGEDIDGYITEDSPLYQRTSKEVKVAECPIDQNEDYEKVAEWIRDTMENRLHGEEDATEQILMPIREDPEDQWDCQSILSTYSNIYNHPKYITAIPFKRGRSIDPQTGMPFPNRKSLLTKKALTRHNIEDGTDDADSNFDVETLLTTISAISLRPPGETSTERRDRKSALKDLRRARREEKKNSQLIFKDRKKLLESCAMNRNVNKTVAVV